MKWADTSSGDFEQPPVGTVIGRCVRVIDIGTQRGEWQGKANVRRQCIVGWELPNDLMTEGDQAGKPFQVSRFYTASLTTKANLRKDLENWRGKAFTDQELGGFDSKNIIGKTCMLSLTLMADTQKVRVTGVMAIPRGTEVKPQITPSLFFSLEEFDEHVFESLSEGIKKFIVISPEYQHILQRGRGASNGEQSRQTNEPDDDIPF